jgi:hypothetical protein
MQYRRGGKVGLKLPEISLGLWHNFGGIAPLERSREIVRRAFSCETIQRPPSLRSPMVTVVVLPAPFGAEHGVRRAATDGEVVHGADVAERLARPDRRAQSPKRACSTLIG